MFCNGRNCRDHPESRMLRNVLQLYERVLKRAVSVDAHQNGPRSVAVNHAQPVSHHSRDSTGCGGTEITATSSSVIETALKSSPLSVRSTVTVFLSSAPATRPDTFCVPPVGLNTISNTLIETPSPYVWQRVKPFSHPARVYGTWDPHFGASSTPMHQPYAVYLFVLYKIRYRLYIFTGYRRVLPRYPILARAKNGVFCNVTAPAIPRAGKPLGRCVILGSDMARMTRPCSGKRRNLTQNAR